MTNFYDLGLSQTLQNTLTEKGFTEPTQIQQKVIPAILMGKDILASAKTGSGKTASYALPMLDMLDQGKGRARMPRAIVLSPTRELAAQVAENFSLLGQGLSAEILLLIGGVQMAEQERVLTRGVDVLIATPGRLLDHVSRGKILLSGVEILVIDEVDRMLDIGFIDDIDKLVKLLPKHQTLMLSATMPKEMESLSKRFLDNPKRVIADPPSKVSLTITHSLLMLDNEKQKQEMLLELLEQPEVNGGIIFSNRKRDVGTIQRYLKRHGLSVDMLHGDMDQHHRLACLGAFREGKIDFLVCSDVAARGLDIPSVDHVFNVDVPSHAEDYVHRIGRTGRAGRKGEAVTLATRSDQKYLEAIEKVIGEKITPHVKSTQSSVSESSAPKPARKKSPAKEGKTKGRQAERTGKTERAENQSAKRFQDAERIPRFLQ